MAKKNALLDFSGACNPLPPAVDIAARLAELTGEFLTYPDMAVLNLRTEIARFYPAWPENVVVERSTDRILDYVIQILSPKRALLLEPSSPDYRRILNQQEVEILSVKLDEQKEFKPSLSRLVNALGNVQLFILGNPNNPTGTGLERDELLELLEEARRRDVFVVVDESWVDWKPEMSVAQQVKDNMYFLIVRALSDFYGFPGLRVCYGLGARKLIERMMHRQLAPACDRIAQRLGLEALRNTAFADESRQWREQEIGRVAGRLADLKSFRHFPSRAPFYLLKIKHAMRGDGFLNAMLEKGIQMGSCRAFAGLDQSFVRLQLRGREDNEKMLACLKSYNPERAAASAT